MAKCEHKLIEYAEDFISGLWLIRCIGCGLCTSEHPTREEAKAEWETKKVED
ncbi:hypothetical protein LCGC14_2241500 [marine sediment metagenome]|uniref:Uncharacterized protein n=1 Tax=marine sediment metagenome TaxID=412755 RepID=A0A0F9FHW7_9ZZZZ